MLIISEIILGLLVSYLLARLSVWITVKTSSYRQMQGFNLWFTMAATLYEWFTISALLIVFVVAIWHARLVLNPWVYAVTSFAYCEVFYHKFKAEQLKAKEEKK